MEIKNILIGFMITAMTLSFGPMVGAKVAYYNNQFSTELKGFGSCQELGAHVQKAMSLANVRRERLYRKGKRGDSIGRLGTPRPQAKKEAASARGRSFGRDTDKGAPSVSRRAVEMEGMAMDEMKSSSGPGEVTGTNNQVANVDEADFVKFDGKHIYQLYSNQLKIIKAWPANSMNVISSLNMSGHPKELLIDQGKVVAISEKSGKLVVSVINVQDPSSPKKLVEFEIPGTYVTARKIGHTLRIVNRDSSLVINHQAIQKNKVSHNGWFITQEKAQKVSAREMLKIQPTVKVIAGMRTSLDVMGDCKNIYVPEKINQVSMTRIISIDLQKKKYAEALAFINPNTIYASEQAIYLAQQGYEYDNNSGSNLQKTAIHKFNIKQGSPAKYAASGKVNGHLINQFALDEYKGNLRAATNGSESIKENWYSGTSHWATVNRVQVLKQKGSKLKVIGKTKNLAKGERLYSVRFNGKKGYLVTFRQVDPLFTLDLSNPYKPKAVGELKVPGFSTYIHMLDDKHLLTIGQDADSNTGRAKGLKLSVFDIRNFKKPREVKSLLFNSHATSEASYEHKAFSFYASKGILAIPVAGKVVHQEPTNPWQTEVAVNGHRSSLLLFKVTTKDIVPSGELNMTDMYNLSNWNQFRNNATVRRSFFADDIVYAIGVSGVRAAKISQPESPLSTVLFENRLATGW